METDKLPLLTLQFCSFYYNSKKEFNSNIIRHLRDLIEVRNEDRENLVPADTESIVMGHIIPSIFLSDKSHYFIYFVHDYNNVDELISHLENDLSTITNNEEDIVVKFICSFISQDNFS
jgi:hypothetical protein